MFSDQTMNPPQPSGGSRSNDWMYPPLQISTGAAPQSTEPRPAVDWSRQNQIGPKATSPPSSTQKFGDEISRTVNALKSQVYDLQGMNIHLTNKVSNLEKIVAEAQQDAIQIYGKVREVLQNAGRGQSDLQGYN